MTGAFTEGEISYLVEQLLGRLATVGSDGQPHVVPVGFEYDADADAVQIGGHGFGDTKKFRDAVENPRVAFVVDDLASTDPWRPRGIEVRGRAETFTDGGEHLGPGFDAAWIQIEPSRIVSWGIGGGDGRSADSRQVG